MKKKTKKCEELQKALKATKHCVCSFSRECGLPQTTISDYMNYGVTPSEAAQLTMQLAFGKMGHYFDTACFWKEREVLDTAVLDEAEPCSTPCEIQMERELQDELREKMGKLRPRERQILSLHLEGVTLSSIAKSMSTTVHRVKKSLESTKSRIKTLYKTNPFTGTQLNDRG